MYFYIIHLSKVTLQYCKRVFDLYVIMYTCRLEIKD